MLCVGVTNTWQHAGHLKKYSSARSCTVRIDQGRAACLESVGTKEFLNEPLVSAGRQIREQVCIVSSAGHRLCMKANTKFLQASFDVVEEALGPRIPEENLMWGCDLLSDTMGEYIAPENIECLLY